MKSSLRNLFHSGARMLLLEAEYYNRVRLSLLRLENPIRLSIPGLHHTDFLLDDETWIAVDQRRGDRPLLALTDFRRERLSLLAPVRCHTYFYQSDAEPLLGRLVHTTHRLLNARLVQLRERHTAAAQLRTVPFRRR